MEETEKSNVGNELAAALSKCQGALSSVGKDREVKGTYSFKYATLSAIWEVVRKPLADNGLSVVQLPSVGERKVSVETRLMHASGGCISSVIELPVAQQTPQGIGSALSYARRYALSAMLGVVSDDDDDDGLAAADSSNTIERRQPQQAYKPKPPQPAPAPKASATTTPPPPQTPRPEDPPPPPPPAGLTLEQKCAEHEAKILAATDIAILKGLVNQVGPSFAGHADPKITKPYLDKLRSVYAARLAELTKATPS